MSKYELKSTIKSYETDATGKVSLANLLYYFQEAANLHATSLDWGMEYLNSIGKFWVLSRMKVRINEFPKHKDSIDLYTWSRGAEGFFAYRDYQVKLSGEICIDAVSSWLILDKNTHRPCKIDQIGKEIPAIQENYLDFPQAKLTNPETKSLIFEKKVQYSDIDINLHVNNGKYLEIIMDALTSKQGNFPEINEFDIQFLHESQLGDELQIFWSKNVNQGEMLLSMHNLTKEKESCRISLHSR